MLSKEAFKANLSGFNIKDVAVRSDGVFYFLVRSVAQGIEASAVSESDVDKRWVTFAPKLTEKNIGHRWFEGYSQLNLCTSTGPELRGICISSGGTVFVSGGGKSEKEEILMSEQGPRRGAIRRARMIHGMAYAVGAGHTVCRRRGSNDWESLCLNLPLGTPAEHDDVKKSEDMAFKDIDGFSHNDLYVIAGRGVVWHFGGDVWRRVPFPSNMFLESVCCAGDGHVYVGAQSGTLFRGRGDKWEMIHRGGMSLPFKDLVWHADRLWCTSDYGLWTVNGKKLEQVEDLPSEISVCAGNLSVADGVMLMGGVHGAAFHDGQKWQLIFNQYHMEQSLEQGS
jgi:hypothetical protein